MVSLVVGLDRWAYEVGGRWVLIRCPDGHPELIPDSRFGGPKVDEADYYFVSEPLIKKYIENHYY